ncbi:elongator complex protein 3 [Sporosalibacterium faouarense]|uniref:elongator complex protein 3 n=1 Tax=Sporosalibacterium faouarense TaxID=516123 RepID=UPI00192B3510|nr:radical SAM protein [Sporosalibacterium faouarense]
MSKKHHIIPIFVPHRGCPHDCVFCNQKKITGLTTDVTEEEVTSTIEEYLKTIPSSNEVLEVAFFGGSFTGIEIEVQKKLLGIANHYKRMGKIDEIRLSTRPDYIDSSILNMLKENGVDSIELGVQSLDEEVLKKSYRGHNAGDVYTAVDLIKDNNFKLGLQMMVGLPGDNEEKAVSTAIKIANLKPDFVRVYPTLVIKETYLEEMYLKGQYESFSIDKTVDICGDILMIFYSRDIPVIRLGLQPTDNVAENKDVVGGPFHPAIRQLVQTKIYNRVLREYFEDHPITNDELIINVNEGEISNLVGQGSSNIRFLKEEFGFRKIKTMGNDISKEYFYIKAGDSQYKIELKEYIEKYITKYIKE